MAFKPTDTRCIFCEGDASTSKSVEHIVPESLGNFDQVLPRGIVCDRCNNYFARKIEGPLLDSDYMRMMRAQMLVPNKRGIMPEVRALHLNTMMPINCRFDGESVAFDAGSEAKQREFFKSLHTHANHKMLFVRPERAPAKLMSRFLAKAAVEAMVCRVLGVDGWRGEIIDNPGLSAIRRYVRIGDAPNHWQFACRALYRPEALFEDGVEVFQILNEHDFFYFEGRRVFFVIAIFGQEYAMDMSDPSISTYEAWLSSRDEKSLLQPTLKA